jgi:hypothetical protein
MLGFGAIGQFAIGQVGAAAGAETITPDKWFAALSEPVRFRPGLAAGRQQFSALADPYPFVSFSWFTELSKPASLTRPGLPPSQQQFTALYPMPSPFVATGWFAPLSEPVRSKPALPPALLPFFSADTAVIPVSKLSPWFAPLSEPVRSRPGLAAARQQFLAAPTQLRPNPTITGVMSALETKDVFLGGARFWDRVISGEIGVIEQNFTGAEIGVVETAVSPGTSGVVETATAPATGTAVPAITTAHVSIRMV